MMAHTRATPTVERNMSESETTETRRGYRVEETSQMLGIPKSTLYRWLANGTLRGIQIGRVVLVPAEELERLLKS